MPRANFRFLERPLSVAGPAAFRISDSYRRLVLAMLFAAYACNFMDRIVFSVMIEPIKTELQLSDTQMGVLAGLAFSLFYALMGIPLARLADRTSRSKIIAVTLALWSAMTALGGFAQNFWTMMLARVGVGVGEAGLSPPAQALICDYYPPEKRTTALGIFTVGATVGVFIGLWGGGWLVENVGWRMTFFIMGAPGLLLAILLWFALKEPPRGFSDGKLITEEAPPLWQTVKFLFGARSFGLVVAAGCFSGAMANSIIAWSPSLMARAYGLPSAEIGARLAVSIGVAGGIGTYFGGWLADRWGVKKISAYALVPGFAVLATVPLYLLAYGGFAWGDESMASTGMTFAILFAAILFGAMHLAPSYGICQSLAPARVRATAAGVLAFATAIAGGLGPQAVGFLSDVWGALGPAESLRAALVTVAVACGVLGAASFLMIGRTYAADVARARSAD